jgi:hypothetical protein
MRPLNQRAQWGFSESVVPMAGHAGDVVVFGGVERRRGGVSQGRAEGNEGTGVNGGDANGTRITRLADAGALPALKAVAEVAVGRALHDGLRPRELDGGRTDLRDVKIEVAE